MAWTYLATAVAAYLIGAVPFGYLIYYAITKQDVREVGSGNIGATNVGRLLGFRFFLLVFTLDLLKGLLPVLLLPRLAAAMGWPAPADLAVAAALGAILGHNFPVYLGFKGGKGVATSLGALLALEPAACGVAAVAFFAVFLVTRYVSLSSMTGGVAFAAAYFWRTAGAWDREHRAMSLLVLAVVVLLIVRHRKNISRLLAGTENRVAFGRRKDGPAPAQPAGMVAPGVLAALALGAAVLLGGSALIVHRARTPVEVVAGPWRLRETHRESTGQQRSEGLAFDEAGERLAVLCPRYNRVLVYRVDDAAALVEPVVIGVDGRPVAIAVTGGAVAVLQRPVNDAKHLEPGWIDVFTLDGGRIGARTEAGFYPDALAATPDGGRLIVLASGRAEGDATKHAPRLSVFRTDDLRGETPAVPAGLLEFEDGEDPDGLVLSRTGTQALATLARGAGAVAVDLTDAAAPAIVGRMDLGRVEAPHVSTSEDGDWIVVPAPDPRTVVALTTRPGVGPDDPAENAATYLVIAHPEDSTLEFTQVAPRIELGRFPVLGPLNLGGAEPIGLAYNGRRRLLAAATKPGAVHVVRLESAAPAAD